MGRRGLRTGNKGGGENEHEFGGNELSSHDALEVKTDKKDSAKKKQGVVSFLKRMKQNSPKEAKEELNSSEDDSEEDSKTEKEGDKKRKGRKIVASDGRRERITRNSTRGRVTREEGRKAAKRGVGRPPKRPEKAAASGKRVRDNVEAEVGVGGRPKKRSRR